MTYLDIENATCGDIVMRDISYFGYCLVCLSKTSNIEWSTVSPIVDHTCVKGYSACPNCSKKVIRIVNAMYNMVFPETQTTYYFRITNTKYYIHCLFIFNGIVQFAIYREDYDDDRKFILLTIKDMHSKGIQFNIKYNIGGIPKDVKEAIIDYCEKNAIDYSKIFV
jgi:hypothetical protein